MHQTPDMVLIVADTELLIDGRSQASCSPTVGRKSMRSRTREIHSTDGIHLIAGETAGASGGTPSAQTFDAFMHYGSVPTGRRGAADTVPAGYL